MPISSTVPVASTSFPMRPRQAALRYFWTWTAMARSARQAGRWAIPSSVRRVLSAQPSTTRFQPSGALLSPRIVDSFTIDGAGGNDRLTGSRTPDHLLGGDGDDTLETASGFDTLDGGAGFDIASFNYTSPGGDNLGPLYVDLRITTAQQIRLGEFVVLTGIEGIDLYVGGAHVLIGDNGNNLLRTSSGGSLLQGLDGDDTLIGADSVEGGAGNDYLRGGHAVGGTGDDIYDFGADRYRSGPRDITELRNEGNDTVIMARSASLSEWLNVENLTVARGVRPHRWEWQ